jgi:hypothetical protein
VRLALAVVIVVVYGAGWVAPMWWLRKSDPEVVLTIGFLGGLLFLCVGVLAGGVAGYLN